MQDEEAIREQIAGIEKKLDWALTPNDRLGLERAKQTLRWVLEE